LDLGDDGPIVKPSNTAGNAETGCGHGNCQNRADDASFLRLVLEFFGAATIKRVISQEGAASLSSSERKAENEECL
jgi:hypothetical protein